jgi:hypothetical protein
MRGRPDTTVVVDVPPPVDPGMRGRPDTTVVVDVPPPVDPGMRGRPLQIDDWRPEDTAEALHAAYRAETNPAGKPRLQALWLMRTGLRMVEVAATSASPSVRCRIGSTATASKGGAA